MVSRIDNGVGSSSSQVFVADDGRIRSDAVACAAAEVAEAIRAQRGSVSHVAGEELFVAMHACGYQASRAHHEAERELWLGRWTVIRDCIVERNMGLAYSMAKRFDTPATDSDELISDAMVCLGRTVELFDPFRGYRFSTYACNSIVRVLLRRRKTCANHRRLFPVHGDESCGCRVAEQPDERAALYAERLRHLWDRDLGGLTEMERDVLARRFPMNDCDPMTLKQVGARIGLSKERVRQIQKRALTKLRRSLQEDPVLR